jgi:hypothetical protein
MKEKDNKREKEEREGRRGGGRMMEFILTQHPKRITHHHHHTSIFVPLHTTITNHCFRTKATKTDLPYTSQPFQK